MSESQVNAPATPEAAAAAALAPIPMPKRLRIGPFRFKHGYLDPVMAAQVGVYGQYQGSNLSIGIVKDMPAERQAETSLHEVLHAIWDTTGLRNLAGEGCPEEEIVTMYSQALANLMRENPEYIAWLIQQLTVDEDDEDEGEGA